MSDNKFKTRNGRDMLLCTMEDRDGMYEAVFFPDRCKKNLKVIMNHSALIIEGSLCLKDGEATVIGKNVISLSYLKKAKDRCRKESIKNNLFTKTRSVWLVQEE